MNSPGSYSINCPLYGVPSAPRSSIDVARTVPQSQKLWANADNLAPVSQLTPEVRRKLSTRSRYECQNNTYYAGAVRTLVNDTVGRAPRLQMLTPDIGLNEAVQELWREWAAASDWGLNMRVLCGVRWVAGECFAMPYDSKALDRMGLPVSLNLRLIEPAQVTHGYTGAIYGSNLHGDDGIECDDSGEVIAYKVMRAHPGDNRLFVDRSKIDTVPAADMLHWFDPERPGQLRGITPMVPALSIFAHLRLLTSATLTAAQTAALLAGVLELPDATLYGGQPADFATTDPVELVNGMLITVPGGGKVTQFKPEHPTANYSEFVNAKLKECGRALDMPFGKISGDYSQFNFSSGKLEDAGYWTARDIERTALEAHVFNPFFYRWCDFARFALPALAAFKGKWWQLRHRWQYDARPVIDGVKDATADELNLTNAADTLSDIAAREGMTEDELLDARAETKRKFEERGLQLPAWITGAAAPQRVGNGQPQAPEKARG